MHGIADQLTSTADHGNSTYLQQVDTAHLHRQPFTQKIAQCQPKLIWTQQKECQQHSPIQYRRYDKITENFKDPMKKTYNN